MANDVIQKFNYDSSASVSSTCFMQKLKKEARARAPMKSCVRRHALLLVSKHKVRAAILHCLINANGDDHESLFAYVVDLKYGKKTTKPLDGYRIMMERVVGNRLLLRVGDSSNAELRGVCRHPDTTVYAGLPPIKRGYIRVLLSAQDEYEYNANRLAWAQAHKSDITALDETSAKITLIRNDCYAGESEHNAFSKRYEFDRYDAERNLVLFRVRDAVEKPAHVASVTLSRIVRDIKHITIQRGLDTVVVQPIDDFEQPNVGSLCLSVAVFCK